MDGMVEDAILPILAEGPAAFLAWLATQPQDRIFDPLHGVIGTEHTCCPLATWLDELGYTGNINSFDYCLVDPAGQLYDLRPAIRNMDEIPEIAWAAEIQRDFFGARYRATFVTTEAVLETIEGKYYYDMQD